MAPARQARAARIPPSPGAPAMPGGVWRGQPTKPNESITRRPRSKVGWWKGREAARLLARSCSSLQRGGRRRAAGRRRGCRCRRPRRPAPPPASPCSGAVPPTILGVPPERKQARPRERGGRRAVGGRPQRPTRRRPRRSLLRLSLARQHVLGAGRVGSCEKDRIRWGRAGRGRGRPGAGDGREAPSPHLLPSPSSPRTRSVRVGLQVGPQDLNVGAGDELGKALHDGASHELTHRQHAVRQLRWGGWWAGGACEGGWRRALGPIRTPPASSMHQSGATMPPPFHRPMDQTTRIEQSIQPMHIPTNQPVQLIHHGINHPPTHQPTGQSSAPGRG